MTRAIIRPAATADVEHAYHWYESQRTGLSREFIAAVRMGIRAIIENPGLHTVIHRNTRRCLLKRFPYALFYRIYGDVIVIVACMHGRRDPLRWKSRN